jgi:hypothetical protein
VACRRFPVVSLSSRSTSSLDVNKVGVPFLGGLAGIEPSLPDPTDGAPWITALLRRDRESERREPSELLTTAADRQESGSVHACSNEIEKIHKAATEDCFAALFNRVHHRIPARYRDGCLPLARREDLRTAPAFYRPTIMIMMVVVRMSLDVYCLQTRTALYNSQASVSSCGCKCELKEFRISEFLGFLRSRHQPSSSSCTSPTTSPTTIQIIGESPVDIVDPTRAPANLKSKRPR